MSDLIRTPAEYAIPDVAKSDLDSIGRGKSEPIEGNDVVLTYSREELGVAKEFPLSNFD